MVSEVTAIDLTTLRRRTECSYAAQFTEKQEVGSPGRIRTYSLSVNSRNDRKSKCPIWCRLREIGSHFSFFGCTQTCTHGPLWGARLLAPKQITAFKHSGSRW